MAPLPTCTDKQLMRRCSAGDRKAWEGLVRRFSDTVYRTIQFSLHRRNAFYTQRDLEDLHNTVFLTLFDNNCKKLRQYKGINGCSLGSWIKLLTIRIVIDVLRKQGKDADAGGFGRRTLEEIPEIAGAFEDPLAGLQLAERTRLLHLGIQKLRPRDRLFVKLHFLEGLPIGKVAEILRIHVPNAYSIKHRALKRLKAEVGKICLQLK